MFCASVNDKGGCLTIPKSPASTAGNSTPHREPSFDFSSSLLRGDLKDEVLVLNNVTWLYPLVSPQDIARLSRSICLANEAFTCSDMNASALTAWRIFQAADRGYNGYIASADLHRVMVGAVRRASFSDRPLVPMNEDANTPLLYWDVLSWWRGADVTESERLRIEHHFARRVVVPSDGLWAGVGTSATLRVWNNICRSTGHLFRFQAENYIQATFRTVESQGMLKADILAAELEVVLYLIREALHRVSKPAAVTLWTGFMRQDTDDTGRLDFDKVDRLLRSMHMSLESVSSNPPPTSRSSSNSSYEEPEDLDGPGKPRQYTLVYLLDGLVRAGDIRVGRHMAIPPGRRNPTSFTTSFTEFWSKLIPGAASKPLPPIDRVKARAERRLSQVVRTYVEQYLALEQWRGQMSAELKAVEAQVG